MNTEHSLGLIIHRVDSKEKLMRVNGQTGTNPSKDLTDSTSGKLQRNINRSIDNNTREFRGSNHSNHSGMNQAMYGSRGEGNNFAPRYGNDRQPSRFSNFNMGASERMISSTYSRESGGNFQQANYLKPLSTSSRGSENS